MKTQLERRALQIAVGICALVPVGAGLAGVLLGTPMVQSGGVDISLDSHYRYLSGLLLGIGFVYWSLIPNISERGRIFRALSFIVFIGGVGRLIGVIDVGMPAPPMLFGLAMELVVTPLLCFWQWRVSKVE